LLAATTGDEATGQQAGGEKPSRQEGKWKVTPVGQLDCYRPIDEQGLLLLTFYSGPSQLWDTKTGKRIAVLREHEDGTDFVAVTPDGSRLVTGDALRCAGFRGLQDDTTPVQGRICVRDRSGKVLKTITVDLSAKGVRWSTDWEEVRWLDKGRLLIQLNCRQNRARASLQSILAVVDVEAGRLEKMSGPLGVGEELLISPDGKRALAGMSYGLWREEDGAWALGGCGTAYRIDVLDLTELKLIGRLDDEKPTGKDDRSIVRRVWAPDSRHVATVGSDHTVRVWDVVGLKLVATLKGHTDWVFDAAFAPDSRSLLTVSEDGTGLIWDLAAPGRAPRALAGHTAGLSAAAFDQTGRFALTGGEDETARLWDVATGGMVRAWPGHESGVRRVAFKADGKEIETVTALGVTRRWSLEGALLSEKKARAWRSERYGALYLKRVADGGREVWSGPPGVPGEATAERPLPRRALRYPDLGATAATPDGKLIATGGPRDTVYLWRPERWDKVTGEGRTALTGLGEPGRLALSPDGGLLAVACRDGSIVLWDVARGAERARLKGHKGGVTALTFSPNGPALASGGEDRDAALWDTAAGKERARIATDLGEVRALAFLADGRRLAVGGSVRDEDAPGKARVNRPGEVRFWDVTTGKEAGVWRGFDAQVDRLAPSPDGKLLAASATDDLVRLWDVPQGKETARLGKGNDFLYCLAFSADGETIAGGLSGIDDVEVVVWSVPELNEVGRFPAGKPVWFLAYTRDGQTLLTGGPPVKFWDAKKLPLRKPGG
jgi:WD40 repeat protein